MARTDRTNRRLELKLVFWGPSHSGKTTVLRSLHGACDPRFRGEFASVESEREAGEPTCYFDYAPMDLPRFRDFALRADCFTVPGYAGYDATRRRLLRGADAVVFVGDVSAGDERNVESWLALHEDLSAEEEDAADPTPVVVLANKRDLATTRGAALLMAQLLESEHRRPILAAVDTVGTTGTGIMKAFRKVVVAAGERILEHVEPLGSTIGGTTLGGSPAPRPEAPAQTYRRLFIDALESQFGGGADGVPTERTAPRRTVAAGPSRKVSDTQVELDTGEINTAVEASRWLAMRDGDVHMLRRERALSRLLSDVGHLCSQATDMDSVIRRTLVQLIMNLDAVTGWVGIPDPVEGEQVYDSMGRARDAAVVAEAAQALALGMPESGSAEVGAAATAGFPGGGAGGAGMFVQFPISGGEPGWLLLVGAPDRGLPEDAEPVLQTATTLLGLTAARIHGLAQTRVLSRALEDRVQERTFELRRQKVELEERIRERERELENAKRAALETERCLFDEERREGVQQLAAGVAHELNNPISAICADVQFAVETLDERGCEDKDLEEIYEALTDALEAARQVGARVTALYGGDVVRERLAAVRTDLSAAVLAAIAHYGQVHVGCEPPDYTGRPDLRVGVPSAELTRWLFRLLSAITSTGGGTLSVELFETEEAAGVRIDLDAGFPDDCGEALHALRSEITAAGGALRAHQAADRARVEMELPAATGSKSRRNVLGRTA